MAVAIRYNAVTPTSRYIAAIDHVAVKAQELAAFLNEMQGIRTAYPEQGDADFCSKQLRILSSKFQALVDEIFSDAENCGLEADDDGKPIICPGFETREMKVVV